MLLSRFSSLVIALLLLTQIIVNAQVDSLTDNIITSKKYREGIYLTFQEFKSNLPSVVDFSVGNPAVLTAFLDYQLYQLNGDGTKRKFNKEFWGFCKGDSIFINLQDRNPERKNTTFAYLESVGKYCAFEKGPGSTSMFMGTSSGYSSSNDRDSDVAFDIESGKFFPLNSKFLKQLVEQNPELKEQFKGMKLKDFSPFYVLNEYNKLYLSKLND